MNTAAAACAWVGIGANLGDAAATVAAAIDAIGRLPTTRLLARSSLWRTAPVDATGPDFVNAVAAVETRLEPHRLLHELLQLELAQGRQRPFPNAPRTLDLDLLLYGDQVIEDAQLTLPHPRMHRRTFVLAPLAEIDAGLRVGRHGSVAELLAALTAPMTAPMKAQQVTRLPPV